VSGYALPQKSPGCLKPSRKRGGGCDSQRKTVTDCVVNTIRSRREEKGVRANPYFVMFFPLVLTFDP